MKNKNLDLYTDLYLELLLSRETKLGESPDHLKHLNKIRIKYEMYFMKQTKKEWINQGGTITLEEMEEIINEINRPKTFEEMWDRFVKIKHTTSLR